MFGAALPVGCYSIGDYDAAFPIFISLDSRWIVEPVGAKSRRDDVVEKGFSRRDTTGVPGGWRDQGRWFL